MRREGWVPWVPYPRSFGQLQHDARARRRFVPGAAPATPATPATPVLPVCDGCLHHVRMVNRDRFPAAFAWRLLSARVSRQFAALLSLAAGPCGSSRLNPQEDA